MLHALCSATAVFARAHLQSCRFLRLQRDLHRQGFAVAPNSLSRKSGLCPGSSRNALKTLCSQTSGSQQVQQTTPDISRLGPAVQQQWNHAENAHLGGLVITPHSHQKVSWRCQAGHTWTASPHDLGYKQKYCPRCTPPIKVAKHPTFAASQHPLLADWDHDRNSAQRCFPQHINLKSVKQIYWLCSGCPAGQEHSWTSPPNDRTSRFDPGCPFCSGKAACKCNSLQALFPDLASEWDYRKNLRHPSDFPACSTKPTWWFNKRRGSWKETIQARTNLVQKSARPQRGQQRLKPVRRSK